MKLQDIARALSAPIIGDDSLLVERIVHPADARGPGDLAIAMSDEGFAALAGCKALATVISAKSQPPVERFKAIIVADQVRPSMAILTRLFDAGPERAQGIHPMALVAADAVIDAGASIGPFVVVGARSRIGANTVLLAHVTVGADVTIGRDGILHPGVRVADRVELGDRIIVHANVVIGADGFSFVPSSGDNGSAAGSRPQKIHSLGTVIVGDDVEIGAGTTIDRATLAATRIGSGTKIDNLVQIAHNATIGEGCLICATVGISGSAKIGDRVQIGGGAGVSDHVTVGSDAMVAAKSAVGSNVVAGTLVSGLPARLHERTLEALIYSGRQKALHAKVGNLQSRVEGLEKASKSQESS